MHTCLAGCTRVMYAQHKHPFLQVGGVNREGYKDVASPTPDLQGAGFGACVCARLGMAFPHRFGSGGSSVHGMGESASCSSDGGQDPMRVAGELGFRFSPFLTGAAFSSYIPFHFLS